MTQRWFIGFSRGSDFARHNQVRVPNSHKTSGPRAGDQAAFPREVLCEFGARAPGHLPKGLLVVMTGRDPTFVLVATGRDQQSWDQQTNARIPPLSGRCLHCIPKAKLSH